MLICPVCGNTDFAGIDTLHTFHCPVAGCDGTITIGGPIREVPVAFRPQGKTMKWMESWADDNKGSSPS